MAKQTTNKSAENKPHKRHINQADTKLGAMRRQKGLSQEELAAAAGVSVETICAYEQRKRDISKAQYRIVRCIASALDCITEDIVED